MSDDWNWKSVAYAFFMMHKNCECEGCVMYRSAQQAELDFLQRHAPKPEPPPAEPPMPQEGGKATPKLNDILEKWSDVMEGLADGATNGEAKPGAPAPRAESEPQRLCNFVINDFGFMPDLCGLPFGHEGPHEYRTPQWILDLQTKRNEAYKREELARTDNFMRYAPDTPIANESLERTSQPSRSSPVDIKDAARKWWLQAKGFVFPKCADELYPILAAFAAHMREGK